MTIEISELLAERKAIVAANGHITQQQDAAIHARIQTRFSENEREIAAGELTDTYFVGLAADNYPLARTKGRRLLADLEQLNERFAIAVIEGKTVVLDMWSVNPPKTDLLNSTILSATVARAYPCVMEYASLSKLYMDRPVTIHRKRESVKSLADIWLEWPGHRKFDRGLIFVPGVAQSSLPPGKLNLFTGWGIEPKDPDKARDEEACSLLLGHIRDVLCNDDEKVYRWLLWWMADIIQNPQTKPGTAIVLAGKKGCGKTLVADVLRRAIGDKHFVRVAKKKDLTGEFSGHLAGGLLVNVEEAVFGGDIEANNVIKDLITSDTILVNEKFVPRHTLRSFSRFIFTTNGDYSHNTSEEERRFLFLDCSDLYVGDDAYFEALFSQLERGGYEAFANILHTMTKPDGVTLRMPPKTEAHARLFAESLSVEERFFFSALVTGEGYPEEAQDKDAWIFVSDVKAAFDLFLDEQGKSRSLKKSDNGFVPTCMLKFWGVDPESRARKARGRKKEVAYRVLSLKEAREMATMAIRDGGKLGLPRFAVGLEDEDEG